MQILHKRYTGSGIWVNYPQKTDGSVDKLYIRLPFPFKTFLPTMQLQQENLIKASVENLQ